MLKNVLCFTCYVILIGAFLDDIINVCASFESNRYRIYTSRMFYLITSHGDSSASCLLCVTIFLGPGACNSKQSHICNTTTGLRQHYVSRTHYLVECDIWPFIGIMNVWLPIEWCGIDGVYK